MLQRGHQTLHYVEPSMVNGEKVVDTNDNDQGETLKYRKHTIVLYVVGSRPNYGLVHDLAKKNVVPGCDRCLL